MAGQGLSNHDSVVAMASPVLHRSHKNTDIEVLRAIAIIGTMIVHIDKLLVWNSQTRQDFEGVFFPWAGVDLFLCISGYVIGGSLLRSVAKSGRERFSKIAIPFWIRRVWRILPSAWLWLLIPIPLSFFYNATGALGTPALNALDAAAAVGQVANFYFWHCFSAPDGQCGIDEVYWSLSLEEQSYILLPILLFFAGRRTVARVLGVVVLAQLFLHRPALSFLWYIRTDSIALGVLLAMASGGARYRAMEPVRLANGVLAVGVLTVSCLVLAALPAAFHFIRFYTGLIALLSAVLVWIASYDKGYILPDGRVKRLLVYLGGRSYAVYLTHMLVFHLTAEYWARVAGIPQLGGAYTLPFIATAVMLTLLLAELNYRFVETPLRRHGVKLAERWMSRHGEASLEEAAA